MSYGRVWAITANQTELTTFGYTLDIRCLDALVGLGVASLFTSRAPMTAWWILPSIRSKLLSCDRTPFHYFGQLCDTCYFDDPEYTAGRTRPTQSRVVARPQLAARNGRPRTNRRRGSSEQSLIGPSLVVDKGP